MIIEQDEFLTDWIKKRIVEICDAEPVAFAKYVLALLKKDSSEDKLREICEEQLNVFLAANTKEFVDSLFDVINSRSYLNGNAESREAAPGTSHDEQAYQDRSDSGRAQQRRRISPPRDSTKSDSRQNVRRRRSRSPYQRRRDGHRSRSRSRSRSPRRDHHRRNRPSGNRSRCRDFEDKGFCRRGDSCIYDHGPDLIVLDGQNVDSFQTKYSHPPPPGTTEASRSANGNAPEAYNPEAPGIGAPSSTTAMPFMPNFSVPPPPLPQQVALNQMGGGLVPMNPYMQAQNVQMQQGGFARGFGRGRGRGRGRFVPYGERVQPNKSSTIEVRRIPPEVNKLGIIHKHFEQFGDITNIQISFDGSPDTALVTYAKLPDAQAAMKSQKPILDNRFIQVAWHKPPPAPTSATAEAKTDQDPSLANVKPVIPLMSEPKTEHLLTSQLPQAQAARRVQQEAQEKLQARRKERQMQVHLQKIHVLKTQLYEKQVAELKKVYERISKATDVKVKIQLSSMAKKLDESLKTLTKEIHETYEQLQKENKKNDDTKSPKKRRLNSTASTDGNGSNLGSSTTEPINEPDLGKNGPPDEKTIRKLLANSSSSEESDGEATDIQENKEAELLE